MKAMTREDKEVAREIVNRNLDELGNRWQAILDEWHAKVMHYLKTGEEL